MKQNLEPIRSKIYEIRGHKEEWDSLTFQIGILEDDVLADQNDINESTRAQLDAISEALAELQPREPKLGKRGLLLIVSFKIIKYQIEY